MNKLTAFPQLKEFVHAFIERETEFGNDPSIIRDLQGEDKGIITKLINVVSGSSMWRFHQDYFIAENSFSQIRYSSFSLGEAQLLMAHYAQKSVMITK